MKQDLQQMEAVLLDIEGTICPISFVKETLFPYAIEALPEVLRRKWDDPEFVRYREEFPPGAREAPEALEEHVRELTARDVKIAYLKNLQGYLWQSGYESGAYSTPLFSDVLLAIQSWHDRKININIYSSGSVFAQKLLFAHIRDTTTQNTDEGGADSKVSTIDKRNLVTEWFDTTNAGAKTAKESYEHIAKTLGKLPQRILFLSDNVKEIEAAVAAGMRGIVVDRPGNAELSEQDRQRYDVIMDFGEIRIP